MKIRVEKFGNATLYCADCLDILPDLEPVETCICDPPYGISFMAKEWDHGIPGPIFWERLSMKPGGILLAFGGTRTFHRLTCAIEDAGFEIRDCLMWLYGSGMPKCLDISKNIDAKARKKWLDIVKAIDNLDKLTIIQSWKENLKNVKFVEPKSPKSATGIGMNIEKNDFVLVNVQLQVNQEKSKSNAIIAELLSKEVRLIQEECTFSVRQIAENNIVGSSVNVIIAGKSQESRDVMLAKEDFTVLTNAHRWLGEKIKDIITEEEVLKIWNGKRQFSNEEIINALIAILEKGLKRIILSQSVNFQNLDITSQMECVSAMNAIITESTMDHLITFMVNILKKEAGRKAESCIRKVVATRKLMGNAGTPTELKGGTFTVGSGINTQGATVEITAPATDEAKKWDGWFSGLKPAWEPIILAMKPIDETFVKNALDHEVSGLNIGGSKIEFQDPDDEAESKVKNQHSKSQIIEVRNPSNHGIYSPDLRAPVDYDADGRFPSNLILDENSAIILDLQRGDKPSRFFYCAKASREERNFGLDQIEPKPSRYGSNMSSSGKGTISHSVEYNPNDHPTVKPIALIQYLCNLTMTPFGGTVLDQFMGSGSTGVAALRQGRKFIGIEKDESFFEIAVARIKAEAQQCKLF